MFGREFIPEEIAAHAKVQLFEKVRSSIGGLIQAYLSGMASSSTERAERLVEEAEKNLDKALAAAFFTDGEKNAIT